MRLGGFFDETFQTPAQWIALLRSKGYHAAYAPLCMPPGGVFPGDGDLHAYRQAAQQAVISLRARGSVARGRGQPAQSLK